MCIQQFCVGRIGEYGHHSSELKGNTFLRASPVGRYCPSIPRNDDRIHRYVLRRTAVFSQYQTTIQAKISFCYFIATFWSVFYIFYFQNLLLLYHIGMPIPYLKKSGIKNPKLITQVVRTIQHSAFGVVLDWLVQLSWIVLDFAIQDFLRYGIAPFQYDQQ